MRPALPTRVLLALILALAGPQAPAQDARGEESSIAEEVDALERYRASLRAALALVPDARSGAGAAEVPATGDAPGEAVPVAGEDVATNASAATAAEMVAEPAPLRDAQSEAAIVESDLAVLSGGDGGAAAGRDGSIEQAQAIERVGSTAGTRRAGEIWRPVPGTTWQWQLTGALDTSVDARMYDIDLFDTSTATIAQLHGAGRVVVCYFSAGSFEDWRPDAGRFPAGVLGSALADWPGERWLDVGRIDALAPVMRARLDLAATKGCDGVEPDNVDVHTQASGFDVSDAEMLAYLRWLADEAHARNLSIALKNNVGQVEQLEPWFDFAINESCTDYGECGALAPFTDAGKAVFGASYSDAGACAVPNSMNYDWIIKRRLLDAWRIECR